MVEICFFNAQYPQGWSSNPFYIANNIQGTGDYDDYNDFQTTLHDEWYQLQKVYVRKIVEEVNGFDNVILEICDEPTTKGTPPVLAIEWVSGLVDVNIDTERALPKRHLIAQQLETELDFSADERVPVIVAQYLFQNDWR